MRKLILKMHVSVDGFVAGLAGESDWIFRTQDEDLNRWLLDTLQGAGAHVVGSRTFQDMAAYWPSAPGPLAAPMNEIPKIVFSRKKLDESKPNLSTRSLKDAADAMTVKGLKPLVELPPSTATWANAMVVQDEDLKGAIDHLKQQPGKYMLAHGGGRFAQSLASLGLIDEYRLVIHPTALGRGLPLFSALTKPLDFKLVSSTVFGAGAMANVYRPA